MTKNQVAILLFAVLLIGLGFYNFHFFLKVKAPRRPLEVEKPSIQEDFKLVSLKRMPFDKGWERNPFFRPGEEKDVKSSPQSPAQPSRPPVQGKKPLPPLKLEMILAVDGTKRAILDGQFVREGDRIGEEIVARIGSDRVMLKRNGKQRTITLDSFSNPFQVEGGR